MIQHGLTVILPEGRCARNFALGKFPELASRMFDVTFWHRLPAENVTEIRESQRADCKWCELPAARESRAVEVLRGIVEHSHMYRGGSTSMRFKLSRSPRGTWRQRLRSHFLRCSGRATAAAGGLESLERLVTRMNAWQPAVSAFRRVYRQSETAVVFCGNQRPLHSVAPVLAAQSLGIPTACFIYSWDNISSKGRIAVPFDHYLVWSHHMKSEVLRYYPHVDAQRIHVVGTPQFDCYSDESLWLTREQFCRSIGADPARPLICFSGGAADHTRDDPAHLSALLELIRDGDIGRQPQVVLRPAPSDDGSRFRAVSERFPELITCIPEWHRNPSDWTDIAPSSADVKFLTNLTRHCELNVNLASTMSLDYAIQRKPVINLAFDVADRTPYGVSTRDYYKQWEHYRPLLELGAVRLAESPEQLAVLVNMYLANPNRDADARARLVKLQLGSDVGASAERVVAVLSAIAEEFSALRSVPVRKDPLLVSRRTLENGRSRT